jgi:hypothetical protein
MSELIRTGAVVRYERSKTPERLGVSCRCRCHVVLPGTWGEHMNVLNRIDALQSHEWKSLLKPEGMDAFRYTRGEHLHTESEFNRTG